MFNRLGIVHGVRSNAASQRWMLLGIASALALGILCTSPTSAWAKGTFNGSGQGDLGNWYTQTPPSMGFTEFSAVLTGDMLPQFGIASGNSGTVYEPPTVDPFCPPSYLNCPVQVTFNPSTNETTVVYTGSNLYSNEDGGYHFGWITVGCPLCTNWLQPLSSSWSNASNVLPVPYLSVRCTCQAAQAKAARVAVIYYEAMFKSGAFVQGWQAVNYIPKGNLQPIVKFTNYQFQAVEVFNTGIVMGIAPPSSPDGWMALLNQMNLAGMPPPGSLGSPFQPLAKPPKKILNPTKPGFNYFDLN